MGGGDNYRSAQKSCLDSPGKEWEIIGWLVGIPAMTVHFCRAAWLAFLPGLPRGLRRPEGVDWWFDGP